MALPLEQMLEQRAIILVGSSGATVVFRYTVVAGDSDTDGIAISPTTISLPNSATIKDGANNDAALDLASYLPTNLGQVTVNVPAPPTDTTAPSISSVTVTGQNYDTDANIDISVVFDENVTVTGAPTLGLIIGADARIASYHSGSSSGATVVFRYTVVAGDSDTDGIAISPTTISLPNSATIKDGANNDAALDLASSLPILQITQLMLPQVF